MRSALVIVELLLEAVAQRHLDRAARNHPELTPEQIQAIGDADPMGGGAVDWLARQVASGALVMPEDKQKAAGLLDTFNRLKDNPAFTGERNLYAYQRYTDLFQTVRKAPKPKVKLRAQQRASGDVILKRYGDLTVHQVKTYQASKKLGEGTNWCIRFPDAYQLYARKGPIYIITKGDEPYVALVPASRQLKDIEDKNPPDEVVRDLLALPLIKDIIKEHGRAQGLRTPEDVAAHVREIPQLREKTMRHMKIHYIENRRRRGIPDDQSIANWEERMAPHFIHMDDHQSEFPSATYGYALTLAFADENRPV